MITIRNNTLYGLSSDTKPTNVDNGIIFHEIDTSKEYMFDASGKEWYEQASEGSGGSDKTIIVTYTMDASDNTTCDHSFSEIMDHIDNGGVVFAWLKNSSNQAEFLQLCSVSRETEYPSDLIFNSVDSVYKSGGYIYISYSRVVHSLFNNTETITANFVKHVVCQPAS